MSQRDSGYQRKARDAYETPPWVTECLLSHIPPRIEAVWECAAGAGQMAAVLASHFAVETSDIADGRDFLAASKSDCAAIVTNPPYSTAQRFIERALELTRPHDGFVAMLLRCDYDHAASRRRLFDRPFAKKIVLTKRIRWIEGSTGSPSFNHAWLIWDWQHTGAPTLAYEPC